MKVVAKSDVRTIINIKPSTPGYVNALRRIMLTEVPVMAIEDVEIRQNSSALYDEMLAHRMGLIALTTDLSSYELPASQQDIDDKKAKCTVQLTLKEKGPKKVIASDFKTADPKIKPVFGDTPIVTLLKDQEVEVIATAVLGKGKVHSKWSPGHVWHTYEPSLKINNKDIEKYKDLFPSQAFVKGKLDEKNIIEHDLVDAVAHLNDDVVQVTYDDSSYNIYIEPWGQLSVQEIVSTALDTFDAKLDELASLIK